MVANYRTMDIRPGSMGRPLPGIEAAVARRDEEGEAVLAADGSLELVPEPGVRGRARAAAGVALDVPRLPRRRGALPEVLRRRVVSHRRPRALRRGRLLLVRHSRRRRHQVRRSPHRPVRGRERPARASRRRRSRRDRQARPRRGRGGQGVHRAPARRAGERGAQARTARLRSQEARRGRRPARDQLRAERSSQPQRQDHAPPAEGAGARPARRGHLDRRGPR